MRRTKYFLEILILVVMYSITININIYGQLPNNDPTWQLVFSDEFDSTAINSDTWDSQWPWLQKSYELSCGDDTVHTPHYSYRTPNFENCELNSGILKIISKEENYVGKCWDDWVWDDCYEPGVYTWCPVDTSVAFNYTTGMLQSKDYFRFGYFEIRCKLPMPLSQHQTKALGPNFWMWNANCGYTSYSEIDVFEFNGEYNNVVNYHTCNSHYRNCYPVSPTCQPIDTFFHHYVYDVLGSVNFNDFQTFGVEWGADRIIYYIDNNIFRISPNPYGYDICPMRMVIDINHPAHNFCDTMLSPFTLLPYAYEVDYVKVWQLNQHCDSLLSVCSFNPDSFDYAIYKSISLGGSGGCYPTVTSGKNVTLRATDGILLDKGFTVDLGGEFKAETTPCQQQEVYRVNKKGIQYPQPPPDDFTKIHKY